LREKSRLCLAMRGMGTALLLDAPPSAPVSPQIFRKSFAHYKIIDNSLVKEK
jgi:hypothetical protein